MSFISTIAALKNGQKIALAGAITATLLAVGAIAFLSTRPDMALLYSDLNPVEAGKVIAALERDGIAYQARGGALFVQQEERDRLRMVLAEQGLPGRGSQPGYELLDGLDGFGTTSEMFDAALWRAREGEIARTIATLPGVKTVRVHLSPPAETGFGRRSAEGAKGSITLTTSGPSAVSPAQIHAIRHLAALSVPGLAREDITVVDAAQGVLTETEASEGSKVPVEQRLSDNIRRLIAARVGSDAVRVSVSVDYERQSQTVRERIFDPRARAMISTETIERQSKGGAAPPVTVDANLPDGGDAPTRDGGESVETIERQNFEVNETVREMVEEAGGVARVSVAVLVDDITTPAPDGTVSRTPRSPEELEALEALVQSAVGFDAGRGDTVTVRSMTFAARPTAPGSGPAESGWLDAIGERAGTLVQIGLLGLIIAAIGFFVIRPILASARPPQEWTSAEEPEPLPAPPEEEPVPGPQSQIEELRTLARERPHQAARLIESWLDRPGTTPEAES
ncbi:MAG TPA: flagellar basal-body MS-ring/collar protein FliF [Alphaproteobacteria bacterium]|nr:flagellar basal-body MS-ring/collar protein FliF [Alphaproteobacteria bacterium]